MKCETVKISTKNEQGFYICNADAIPKGAKIYSEGANGLTEAEVKKYTAKAVKDIAKIKAKEAKKG